MSKLIKNTKKRLIKMERGQVLMVVAIAIVGIIGIVGLAMDVGVMFIENARLRRAVDSSALAAALQFREGYQVSELDSSAREFLRLNGINDPSALVQICDGPDYSHTIPPDQCPVPPAPPRKLVRVVATGKAYLAFLPVIGIDSVPIAAEATSETASVDVVLVIDRSESMTGTAKAPTDPSYSPMRDPSVCNNPDDPSFNPAFAPDSNYDSSYTGYCRPFDEVKKAAVSFVEQLYFPYDRVAVVTFDKNWNIFNFADDEHPKFFSNIKGDIISAIKGLTVYEGEGVFPNGSPSRWYDSNGLYWGLQCPIEDPNPGEELLINPDWSGCTSTNIGAGLDNAGRVFNFDVNQNSLWVVILLTDGVANAGYDAAVPGLYFCPESTWLNGAHPPQVLPKCNDGKSATRHATGSPDYDAEDYAYDGADFVAHDQNALIFTIGMGNMVKYTSSEDGTALGELFLKYAADQGLGTYTFEPDPAGLAEAFGDIAKNIATRLTH
ncbi:MAG TPA: VWA domain-containing protein [Anaerolineales bacterium]